MELKSRDRQKAHLGLLLNVYTKFQLPSPIWGRDREGTNFFQAQKREKHHIFSPNWPRRLIFGYVMQLWILYRLTQKGTIFAFLIHSYLPLPNWSIAEFWLRVVLAHMYLIRHQTDPIDQTGAILASIEQCEWIYCSGGGERIHIWNV